MKFCSFIYVLFLQESRPSSRTKPVPPKKPERLSLQRTTSMQSVDEGPVNSRASASHTLRNTTIQTWQSLDNDLCSQETDHHSHSVFEQERFGFRSREHSFDRLQERSHYISRERGHDHLSNGDGSVRMVVNSSPVTGEHLSRRPSPQGAASTSISEGTPRRTNYRSHSPDSAFHLESDHFDGQESDIFRAEIYSSPSHPPQFSSYSHQHHHPHSFHRYNHNHYHPQTPSTPVASRSSTLSVATSPRPNEQWC